MTFVQLTQRTGTVRGSADSYTAPNDGLIELHLESHQRVVHVTWKRDQEHRRRKTVDWTWTATIETRC